MCGIAGIVNLDERPLESRRLRSMLCVIRHRGPDDGGFALIDRQRRGIHSYSETDCSAAQRQKSPVLTDDVTGPASIGFGHRRFSIIERQFRGYSESSTHVTAANTTIEFGLPRGDERDASSAFGYPLGQALFRYHQWPYSVLAEIRRPERYGVAGTHPT